MNECHDYQDDGTGEKFCTRCGVQYAAEGEVTLVYHFRGDLRAVCETPRDAQLFRDKQKEDPSEFYTETWKVKYYE